MNVLDVLNAPWAIQPEKLQEIQGIYAARKAGLPADLDALAAAAGKPLTNEHRALNIEGGVALISIEGVIAKRMNLFTQISGGTSTEVVANELQQALAAPAVNSILLAIDSPGGSVDGTQTLAEAIYAARRIKPVVALASGVMASAAYWIGSAAHAVYVADATTLVGSIGVVASHVDVSQSEARQGVKTTEIYAGKYKRIASSYAPLSDEGRKTMQDQVDHLYSVFVGDVARYRDVSVSVVLESMADGKVFVGEQALRAGLVDGVLTRGALVSRMQGAARNLSN